METLEINKSNALKAYKEGDAATKKMLQSLFGEKTFYENITDRVKTFEDACSVMGINPDEILIESYSEYLEDDIVSINAYVKLIIIASALNEGWKPDWSNGSQSKYVPWFKEQSGFGLSCYVCGDWLTGSLVGSRLCYKSKELAEYAGKQFADIYNDYLTIKK